MTQDGRLYNPIKGNIAKWVNSRDLFLHIINRRQCSLLTTQVLIFPLIVSVASQPARDDPHIPVHVRRALAQVVDLGPHIRQNKLIGHTRDYILGFLFVWLAVVCLFVVVLWLFVFVCCWGGGGGGFGFLKTIFFKLF